MQTAIVDMVERSCERETSTRGEAKGEERAPENGLDLENH